MGVEETLIATPLDAPFPHTTSFIGTYVHVPAGAVMGAPPPYGFGAPASGEASGDARPASRSEPGGCPPAPALDEPPPEVDVPAPVPGVVGLVLDGASDEGVESLPPHPPRNENENVTVTIGHHRRVE